MALDPRTKIIQEELDRKFGVLPKTDIEIKAPENTEVAPIVPEIATPISPLEQSLRELDQKFGAIKNSGLDYKKFDPYIEGQIDPIQGNIKEERARNQSGWQLLGSAVGQTANEAILGSVEGVGQLLNTDIFKAESGEKDFENAFVSAIGGLKEDINQEIFPIYQTGKSLEGTFSQKLGDATWWASNFPTVASTASMLIPALGASRLVGGVGRMFKLGDKVLDATKSIAAATTSRYVENNMESQQRFKQSYNDYIQKGLPDEEARSKAGEDAARVWKYNSAMLAIDMVQYASLLKPFKAFAEAAEITKKSGASKVLDPIIQTLGEAGEEGYQFISSEEAAAKDPFGKEFFNTRFSDYLENPDMQSSMFWGAAGGGVMQAGAPIIRKIAKMGADYSTKKMTAATFGDVEKAKNLDQDSFVDLLTRNYSSDKLGRMQGDLDAFYNDNISREDITPEEKQEITEKHKEFKEQVQFVQDQDSALLKDPKFKNNPEVRKTFVLQQLEAKTLSEDIETNNSNINSFYSSVKGYDNIKPINKEINTLNSLKKLKKNIKDKDLLDVVDSKINAQEEKVKSLLGSYKDIGTKYKPQIIPGENMIISAFDRLERDKFKHDHIIQPELLKYQNNSQEATSQKESEIINKQKESKKRTVEEAVESAETSQDIEDITSVVGTEEFEANNPPEVAEAIFGKINKKAKEESVIKGTSTIPTLEGDVTIPIVPNRWDDGIHKFTAEKVGFMGKLISLEDKTPEETSMIRKLGSSKKEVMYTNLVEAQKYPRIAEEVNNFFNQQDKLQTKSTEEKELDKQIDKLQSNPVDSEVESTIEPTVSFTTDIPTEKSNVFHINASQFAVKVVDKRRQVIGDKLPFANQFNWEAINNLPIGSELTARIDPDHIVYIGGKPLKNSEVSSNQQLVSLFTEDGVEVGILYTQNEVNKALFPIWRSEVQNKGEKKFKVVQKYKGDINTYTEIKDGDITIPAARNSLTDIERACGKKLILGYVHGTTAGSIVKTSNKDIPEIRLGAKNKSGQIVVALPKGNGEYMAYSLITKSLKQGEGVDYKNVPLAENNAFKEVLDSLKGLKVGDIEGNEILIDKLHEIISLPTIISSNKKTGSEYIQFSPVHIKKKHLITFEGIKGISFYLKEGKKDGDLAAYNILVSKNIIDGLELQEYTKGTPEAVMMDFLGEMKLQIDGDKLNQDDYYETVSKRTKTNLANDPVVNVSFFIQPTTDEVQLTPKEVDTTVQKSKTKDISDIKKEEELPIKELEGIKDNITEVSNLDQTDGKPVKIETPTKRGKTTLVKKPKLRTGTGEYQVWDKEKELAWLSKQLPNIPVEVLNGIAKLQQGLDVDVYGRFENSLDELNPVGTIKLAENTKEGTAYHEAFHTVFWVGLNTSQRTMILKQAKDNFGDFSDDTLEEILADKFIDYVQTEGNIELKGNFIKNFFEKIYNWIKYNVFGQVEIKNLYYRINSGQYANLKPVKVNVSKLSSSLRPAVLEDRVNTLVANFSLAIDNYVDEHPELVNLTRTQLLKSIDTGEASSSIEYFLTQAYNSLYEDYESDPDSTWGKQMAVFLNETVKGVSPEGKVLWGPVGKKALQKIGAREGFKVHANQILGVQNANPDEEYEISEEETRSEGWQVDVKSQSGQMGLSNEVRKELSYIPLTGDKAVDDLGYQRYVDFDTVYATLKRELADLYTAERIEKKLQEITSTTRPELIEVYNKFVSEEPNNKLFRTKFVNDFAKTHVDFKMAVQKNDGRVAIYSSNSTTIVNMIIDNWQSEFYNNGYFTPDGNVNIDKIAPITDEILKAPTVVEKMKLFNDKFNLDLDSRVFDNISQDMLYIIGDLKAGNNIFETNTTKLKDLAKLDAKYKTDLLESSFRNIEGKTVYSHILPSFTSKQIANMKYDFETWYNYYSTDPFYKNSPLLNAILKDKSILDNLEYSMIDGSKYKGESEGTSYADFSDKQFLSMQINMFHNNGTKSYGWYQTPILSDSPEGVYIKLPKYKTADALDKLVEVAKQEYERIKESHDNKLGVKNFDENSNKFLFMTFLRRPDLEKSDAEIRTIIKEGLVKKFNDYWDFLQKNNIFDLSDNLGVTRELIPNYFKLKEEKRTTLTEEESNVVKASIWNYFLNQVYAGSQIITLTTGDPAFYKSVTDYYKRAKEIVSPTMQMDTSAVYILSEEEIKNEGNIDQISIRTQDANNNFEIVNESFNIETGEGVILGLKYKGDLRENIPTEDRENKVKYEFEYLKKLKQQEIDKINNLSGKINSDGNIDLGNGTIVYIKRLGLNTIEGYKKYALKEIEVRYGNNNTLTERAEDTIPLYESTGRITEVYLDDNGNISGSLGTVGIEIPKQIQGKGFGKDAYRTIAYYLKDKKNLTLKSDPLGHSESAHRVWESLRKSGEAKLIKGTPTDFSNNFYTAIYEYIGFDSQIPVQIQQNQVITPGENYTTLYLNDVNIVGQIGKELFDNFTKTGDIFYAQTAAKYGYSNDKDGKFLEVEVEGKKYKFKSDLVNVADAQTFISPNRYRKVAVGYGRWNKQIQQTFGRMVSNKTLLPEDYDVAIQPYKPFVFGHIKQGNKIIPVQNKNSEMTLFPQLAKASPTLQKLYDIMQENNLDSISFESVVKVGLSNTVSWEDLQKGVDIKDKIHTLDNSNYGVQQEVPEHYIDDSALFGTQIMKHVIANLDLNADYNGRTGQQLADYFQKLISENVETSYKQAREELGLSGDVVDNKKLSEILQREILSRDLGEDIFEAAGLDINGEFNIHPADPLHNDRNEKLLNSIYKNRVTKQKIKGGSFVQSSGIGFIGELELVLNESGNAIKYAECMLPWSSRKHFEPFMNKDGLIDINKVPLDLLDMIGYRIPTEDKYSMLPLRVVDFLPAQMGGVVMLPMEITTLAGSDFDVDKLYIMMPEFEISSDKQDIRKITDTDTTEGRNNKLIDLMRDVLTNEKTFKQFIKPGGFADLQKNANIIYLVAEKVGKYSDIVNWSDKQINDAVESLIAKQGIDLTSPLSNARMFNRNMTGKKLVGIEANHNANHSILQFTNIELSKPIIIDGKTYKSLQDIYNNAGELISNNVAQRLAAVVDNAKDPNAFKANLNTYTADVDALLTRLGVPMIQSFALLKQPIVVELTRLYYLHGGDFNAEETAIKEVYDNYPGGYVGFNGKTMPDLNKIEDPDISQETLIDNLSKDWKDDSQLDVFIKFLLYKNRAKSLADLIRSMGSMTNGAGPTLADNEIVIRNQRQILADENLVGVAELFSGEKYPLFKAFNDNGLIKPQEDLKKIFPLGNTNEDSWVNKTKLLLQNSIAKNKLSAKDLNKFNNFILSYISDGFELYNPKLQKYFIESFPAKYKETLEANPELKEFRITKFIEFKQDDNFPFGRLEFNNTGALTNTLKDDLKDSWYQMFTDDNPETRKFALNLFRYSKYKEGFLFGPKTFTHLQPTKFFTSTEEGKVINQSWKKVFKAENLDMNPKDSERVIKQYIRNNWKNTGFVPIITESHKVTQDGDKPIAVNIDVKDSKYKTDIGFVEFVKVPVNASRGKKVETTYVLMEKVYQTYNKQGQPITAVYRPTNKLGKSAFLVETNRMLDNFSSILLENNVGKVADVDIRKLANNTVEEVEETFESEENVVSLQEESSKTKSDILESFELYASGFEKLNITKADIETMSEEELGSILRKLIC